MDLCKHGNLHSQRPEADLFCRGVKEQATDVDLPRNTFLNSHQVSASPGSMAERAPGVRCCGMQVQSQDGRSGYSSKITNNPSLILQLQQTQCVAGAHVDPHAVSNQHGPLSHLTCCHSFLGNWASAGGTYWAKLLSPCMSVQCCVCTLTRHLR